MRMLDLFSGRWGWGRTFAERGWDVVGVDLVEPSDTPPGCRFVQADILQMASTNYQGIGIFLTPLETLGGFDFVCASSPCEEFSVWGQRHFHPDPPYPEMGVKLFNHTQSLCKFAAVPYVLENVRPAQKFVGDAVQHAGPFYFWGTGVPLLVHQGITKGYSQVGRKRAEANGAVKDPLLYMKRSERAATLATIPLEVAHCVAVYAERLIEQQRASSI